MGTKPEENATMCKFVTLFSYRAETWERLIKKPANRGSAIQAAIASLSGTVESVYYMIGEYDGIVTVDLPDVTDAAAITIAVTSTGAFSKVETRQLVPPEDMPAVLEKAGRAREAYAPPGG
jgi:uncharacterized protein with GYD domain